METNINPEYILPKAMQNYLNEQYKDKTQVLIDVEYFPSTDLLQYINNLKWENSYMIESNSNQVFCGIKSNFFNIFHSSNNHFLIQAIQNDKIFMTLLKIH